MKLYSILFIVLVSYFSAANPTTAQINTDTIKDTIELVTQTAERLCGFVSQSGSSTSITVKGDVKGELSKFIKSLVDLGISGAGSLQIDSYEGVIRDQLSQALKDERNCKTTMFTFIFANVIPTLPVQDQRITFMQTLTKLYILSHNHISPEMIAGLEWPPEVWLNDQLEKRALNWRVHVSGQRIEFYSPEETGSK